jgi:hypothetical protein
VVSVEFGFGPVQQRRFALPGIAAIVALACGSALSPAQAQMLPGDSAYAPVRSAFPAAMAEFGDEPRTRVYITPRSQNAFCVRGCDGRFFPLPRVSEAENGKICEAVCPSAEMKLYSGSDIAAARSEQGEPYTALANAFRFQREIVPKCACNASAAGGLTHIAIEDDVTLRSGDIVADDYGFSVAAVSDRRSGRSIIFRPLSKARTQALGLARLSSR